MTVTETWHMRGKDESNESFARRMLRLAPDESWEDYAFRNDLKMLRACELAHGVRIDPTEISIEGYGGGFVQGVGKAPDGRRLFFPVAFLSELYDRHKHRLAEVMADQPARFPHPDEDDKAEGLMARAGVEPAGSEYKAFDDVRAR